MGLIPAVSVVCAVFFYFAEGGRGQGERTSYGKGTRNGKKRIDNENDRTMNDTLFFVDLIFSRDLAVYIIYCKVTWICYIVGHGVIVS